MSNCLIYALTSKHAPNDQSIPNRIISVDKYSRTNGWNIVDHIADKNESVKCVNKAKFPNLRCYFAKHHDIDIVIVVYNQVLSTTDYTTMKAILTRGGVSLIVVANRPDTDESSNTTPVN